ncbi:UbiD family decarboxylase [Chloroflexota bacterium]
MGYVDLREYLGALENQHKLHHVEVEVDKDWEVAAVSRRVFQRIPSHKRQALQFNHVKGFAIPIVVGTLGASPEVYALALKCAVEEISDCWDQAQLHPIKPQRVNSGPCQENVLEGEKADITIFPIPIWTVEHDPGPYITAGCVVTRDPATGAYNVGTYRLQVKDKRKLGIQSGERQHGFRHRQKYEARDLPTPVAIVLGPDPTIEMASVGKFSPVVDEYDIAGGLRKEPVPLVKCVTVPLEVPATAEIVIEGEIPPMYREPEGPFGEYTGYMSASGKQMPVINITCITHRNNPIYRAFFSQMPPSESSCIRRVGQEQPLLKHLKDDLALPVRDVHITENSGASSFMLISVRDHRPGQVKQIVHAAWGFQPGSGKFTIVMDDDIDIRDPFWVEWAMSTRVQPERDIEIERNVLPMGLDPSHPYLPPDDPAHPFSSKVLIDATRKHAFPPLALPPQEHLRRVDAQWDKYGL